jgi:hypothetical protein
LIRNDFIFNDVIISSPDVGMFRTIYFYAEMENLKQGVGSTLERHSDKQAQTSTLIFEIRMKLY